METNEKNEIRSSVRDHYGKVAEAPFGVGCAPGCCAPTSGSSLALGYSQDDLAAVPEGADLGLGCGNPRAIASLQPGEVVLDLGSGAGFDCFLAAAQVGTTGKVIGVDMTPAMLTKARGNAERAGSTNVEFRLGEIERLPVGDAEIDVVISNCVVNLSPDKEAVFREAFRVLKPGGRIAISDVIALVPIPAELKSTALAISACVAGAWTVPEVESALTNAGFTAVVVDVRAESREFIAGWLPGSRAEDFVASASIRATRPAGAAACCAPSCCG